MVHVFQKLIMFRSIFLFLILTSLSGYIHNRVNYTVKVNIKGLPDRTRVYLLKLNSESKIDTVGTTLSKGESFKLKGSDDIEGKFHALAFDSNDIKKVAPKGLDPLPFIIENNNFSVSGDIDLWPKVSFAGSETNENYYKLIEEIRAINKDMRTRFPRGGEEMDSIYSSVVKQALLKYPDNYGTSAITEKFTLTLKTDELKEVYNAFSHKVKNSYYGKIVNKTLHYLTDAHNIMEGKTLPDFKLVSETGDSISISKFAASKKYVLIDFWASWCSPCKQEIPKLKEVYKKYAEKGLGIVSISIDKSKSDWEKAIKKEAMPWAQMWDPQELVAGNIFRASSIPVYVLIDKNGKLISFYGGAGGVQSFGPGLRGDKLQDTLSKLFGF